MGQTLCRVTAPLAEDGSISHSIGAFNGGGVSQPLHTAILALLLPRLGGGNGYNGLLDPSGLVQTLTSIGQCVQ